MITHDYPQVIKGLDPNHGDIIFGGRRSVRGVVTQPFDSYDGNYQRALKKLEAIDVAPVIDLQENIGPVTLFFENMVYHSVDYGYREDPPPPLIGFDIYASSRDPKTTVPSDPFEDDFEGFLPLDDVMDLFDDIGIPHARCLEASPPVDPESISIPRSELGPVNAEGIIFRTDTLGARAKKVSKQHQEANRRMFGGDPENASSGAEYLAEKFCTPARIRKQIYKLVEEENKEFGPHLNETLYPRVVEDIWREEWPTIMRMDREITPTELYPIVADRCIKQLRQMEINADLNDVDAPDLWRVIWDSETDPGIDNS